MKVIQQNMRNVGPFRVDTDKGGGLFQRPLGTEDDCRRTTLWMYSTARRHCNILRTSDLVTGNAIVAEKFQSGNLCASTRGGHCSRVGVANEIGCYEQGRLL